MRKTVVAISSISDSSIHTLPKLSNMLYFYAFHVPGNFVGWRCRERALRRIIEVALHVPARHCNFLISLETLFCLRSTFIAKWKFAQHREWQRKLTDEVTTWVKG